MFIKNCSCFGKIVSGFELVARMLKQPGGGNSGFISDKENFIKIVSIQLIPSGQYQPPPIPPAIAKQLLRGKANN